MTNPSTTVAITGTGVPHSSPGRVGAGTLARHGSIALQFDGGRGTIGRDLTTIEVERTRVAGVTL